MRALVPIAQRMLVLQSDEQRLLRQIFCRLPVAGEVGAQSQKSHALGRHLPLLFGSRS